MPQPARKYPQGTPDRPQTPELKKQGIHQSTHKRNTSFSGKKHVQLVKDRKDQFAEGTKAEDIASCQSAEERYALFVDAYIRLGQNGTRAALEVGYSERSAASTASTLLRHAKVKHLLEQRRSQLVTKYRMGTEDAVRSLNQAITFDPRKLYDEEGRLKRITELDYDTAMAITSIKQSERFVAKGDPEKGEFEWVPERITEIKWVDRNQARDQLNRILGLYKDADKTPRKPEPDPATVDEHGNVIDITPAVPDDPVKAAQAYQRLITGR